MDNEDIIGYNNQQSSEQKAICELLMHEITSSLPGSAARLFHSHPAWFIDGNPIVGYDVSPGYVNLLFWSGQSFDEPHLAPKGTFKAAGISYGVIEAMNIDSLRRWLHKSAALQWDYKNLRANAGQLVKISA